ncbi:hypothetical protein [Hansschlegelia zhihuaiae]|uniref:CO dehydrogenase flavoprotein C-terminal domain-containing protein n=1 Tax=Hansschlegelia zhihuaiae TaxID=405005 RepID=A0A4Q0MM14_9HYPH|nr:hypothetical protein [Hansschlegelia zhihuaiae]RXF74116.1 hypothetical protein EK403_07015 [Hansschlegelia zhihuaiae]
MEIEDGVIRSARIAAGGVGTMPWRMRDCEAALAGKRADRQAFEDAARLAAQGHATGKRIRKLPIYIEGVLSA